MRKRIIFITLFIQIILASFVFAQSSQITNGPLTGLIEKLPKYKESQNLPRPLFNNEGSEPAGNFNASSSPPFQKGDTGGFLTSTNEPIILAQAGNPPADADLAETIDVQLTPAIRAKAQELGYNPVKIY
ncbi:MAG: hypothetical protein WC373_10290, partial [Smithella sp.]